MKVLLVHADLSARGGAEAYADAVARWLDDAGHDIRRLDIHGMTGPGATSVRPGLLRVGTLPGLRRFGLLKYALVCRVLPRLAAGCDRVIFTFGEGPATGRPSLTIRHAPALFSTRGDALDALGAAGRGQIHRVARTLYTLVCRRIAGTTRLADGPTLVNSAWTAEIARRSGAQDTDVLYPPVRPHPANGTPRAAGAMLALGRIVPNKRHDEAIAILRALRARGLPATLDIAGRANTRYARRLIASHSEEPGLRFHPDADPARVARLLGRARFGLHAYRNEHFGIAVGEMITAGVVPMVHDGGGVRELVPLSALRYRTAKEATNRLARLIAAPPSRTDRIAAALMTGPALTAAIGFEDQLAAHLGPFLDGP